MPFHSNNAVSFWVLFNETLYMSKLQQELIQEMVLGYTIHRSLISFIIVLLQVWINVPGRCYSEFRNEAQKACKRVVPHSLTVEWLAYYFLAALLTSVHQLQTVHLLRSRWSYEKMYRT